MTLERDAGTARRVDLALDLWVLVPVVLLAWPLLVRRGYPFSRDLVFTPALPLRPEALGLGTGSPRAAPLDAVVGLVSTVVDGAVVGRVAVIGVLALAGWGAHRVVRGTGVPARVAVAGLAVWNPFVVERLGLGQWALLAAYAALFWLVRALTDQDLTARDRRGRAAPWLLLGALTPTGALLVGVTTVIVGVRRRADAGLALLAGAVQLPWLLPALLSAAGAASAVSDPAAIAAFAARAERPGPALFSLVGLGGIWDAQSVPGSREGWLGHVTTALVVVALVVSLAQPPAADGPRRTGLGARSRLPRGGRRDDRRPGRRRRGVTHGPRAGARPAAGRAEVARPVRRAGRAGRGGPGRRGAARRPPPCSGGRPGARRRGGHAAVRAAARRRRRGAPGAAACRLPP